MDLVLDTMKELVKSTTALCKANEDLKNQVILKRKSGAF